MKKSPVALLALLLSFYVQNVFSQGFQSVAMVNDDWVVSNLHEQGFDLTSFVELEAYLEQNKYDDLQSVSVFRNNKMVYDHYFNGSDASSIVDIRSATKSIISLLVGIAIDQGAIKNIDEKITPYFSEYQPIKHLDDRKKAITIRHLLTMTAGFDSDDDVASSVGNENNLDELSSDWVRYSIDVPMLHQPGEHWAYSSMNTFLLGYVLEKATGQKLDDFAKQYLFQPLNIDHVQWRKTPLGRKVAQGNFCISSRNLGKIGQLLLDKGLYKDQRIVSEQWIKQSITGVFQVPWDNYDTYGFKWYNHTLTIKDHQVPYILASGNGGNKLYVVPQYNVVVTVLSTAYGMGRGHERSLAILRGVLSSLINNN